MRSRKLATYTVNGWLVERRPNTFAEQYVYEATAVDAAGYQTAKHGFSTLRAAKAFCETHDAPKERPMTERWSGPID